MPQIGSKQKKRRNTEEEKLLENGSITSYGTSKEVEEAPVKDEVFDAKPVSVFKLFKYAEGFDIVLLIAAICCSIVSGLGWPLIGIVYGDQVNVFMDAQMAHDKGEFFPEEIIANNKTFDSNYTPLITPQEFKSGANSAALSYFIIGIIVICTGYIEITCWLTLSERMIHKIRKKFFRAVMRQDIAWFDAHQSGEMTTKLSDSLERMKEGMGDKLGLLIEYLCGSIAGTVIGFSYNWKLTLVVMAAAPFMGFGSGYLMMTTSKSARDETAKNGDAGKVAEEVLSNIRTVIAFNGQEQECSRYKKHLDISLKSGLKRSLFTGIDNCFSWLIVYIMYALAFWYGVKMVNAGEITRGGVFTVLMSVFSAAFNLADATPQISLVSTAKGAAAAIFQIIDREPEIDSYSTEGRKLKAVQGRVELKNVDFHYPSRKTVKVLDDISFTVEPGETIALVGSSGSGKSTIVNLLLRYYDPDSGQITIDGQPLNELNIHYLRNIVGVVNQEPILFATTIEENIRFGEMNITQSEMVEAAKMANAHTFINKLPEGYQTIAGERGTQLSGGQKQRVAIARALVRNPKILLLDEATSALDAESESIVQAALEKASKGRTTIIIAHRLSTIKNADKILAMQHGKIMEVGTHSELMDKKGLYYQLVTAQLFEDTAKVHLPTIDEQKTADTDLDLEEKMEEPILEKNEFKPRFSLPRKSLSVASVISGQDEYEEETNIKRRKTKQEELKSEQERLKKALTQEGLKPASFLQIVLANKEDWHLLLLAFIGTIVKGASRPVYSLIYGFLFRDFTLEGDELVHAINFWCGMFIILGVVQGVAVIASYFFFGWSSERLSRRLRINVFRNVLSQSVSFFDDPKNSTGKISTRLATDAPNVKAALDYRLGTSLSTLLSMIGGIILALTLGWQMALLGTAILPIMAIALGVNLKLREASQQQDTIMMEEAGKVSSETIQNIRTVQALTREDDFYQIYSKHLETPFKHNLRRTHLQGIAYGFSNGLIFLFFGANFRFGAYLVLQHLMEPISVYRVFTALLFAGFALGMVTQFFPEYVKAKFSAALMFKMLKIKPSIDNLSTEGLKPDLKGQLQFNDVHFAYPMRPAFPVLKGMNFSVEVGKAMALVGTSGCGKSTVVSLIERFYDPTSGYVSIDAYDLKQLNVAFIRNQISLVSQEPILFDISIEKNITYGLENIPHDEVVEAARLSNIHDFICSLPQGYDTKVGEKGTQLSGGQKQRVAIARALIRKPRILLLDEATSALDTESEQVVQKALDKAREGRTCIIIAHRLSTVQTADVIAVVKDGEIIERGNHSDLIAQKGVYYELTKKQAFSE